MKWKLKVLNILDSIENEKGVRYYKVKFQQTWLPSSVLQSFNKLIDEYWKDQKTVDAEIVNKGVIDGDNDDVQNGEEKGGCFFCGDVIDFKNLNAHEQRHMEDEELHSLSCSLQKRVDDRSLIITINHNFGSRLHDDDSDLYCDEEMVVVQPGDATVDPQLPDAAVEHVPKIAEHVTNKLHCPKCNLNFRNFFEFRCHYHNDHMMTSDCFECEQCHRKFNSKELYEKHYELHTAANRRLKSYGDKIKSVSKDNTCPPNKQKPRKYEEFSPDVLNSARQYIKSVSARRKRNTQERQKQLVFDMTDACHPRIDGIGVDVELSASEDAVPDITMVSGRQAYRCKVCGKTFFNRFHHREHFNVHSGEMPYICEFCSKRFAQRSGWNRHIKLHHKYKAFSGPLPRGAEKSMMLKTPKDLPNLQEALTVIQGAPASSIKNICTRDPNTLHLSDTPQYLPISPSKASQAPGDVARLPLSSDKNKDGASAKQVVFQCKKVRSMYGTLVFMIRVSHSCQWRYESRDFAYILDDSGLVKSRIFVDDYPGGDWLDFPLDETANDVLLARINRFDLYSRRGPKPTRGVKRKCNQPSGVPENTQPSDPSLHDDILQMSPNPKSTDQETIDETEDMSDTDKTSDTSNGVSRVPKSSQGRIFRSGKEKRFQCQVCSRKFLAQAHLNDHMRIHTGEHPYKCMFCARPFRHKSGLNSHHKRHIQRGVFNRPISSMPLNAQNHNSATYVGQTSAKEVITLTTRGTQDHCSNEGVQPPPELENIIMKSKRKGRTPKQHIKAALRTLQLTEPFKVKEEKDLTVSPGTDNVADIVSDNSLDNIAIPSDYDCNFCGMKFQLRTVYLKHLNAVHKSAKKANNALLNAREESSAHDEFALLSFGCGEENSKEEGMKFDPLFADVKIKEELIDDDY